MDLYKLVEEKLPFIDKIYDTIRIVDPVNKKYAIIKEDKISGTCYDYWKRGLACNNCISTRAYSEKDTFVKIDYKDDKVFLVTATPLLIKQLSYVVEMIKDISENERILDINTNMDINLSTTISEINDNIAKKELTEVTKNRDRIINANYAKSEDIDMLILMGKIEELRSILNEMYVLNGGTAYNEQKLNISQYLDKLIVEYMIKVSKIV